MIATIILGIGLVMVATIFPVAVEQTRIAIQNSIIQSVADSAVETLRLRLRLASGIAAATTLATPDGDSGNFPGDRPHSSFALGVTGGTDDGASIEESTRPSAFDTDPGAFGLQAPEPSPHTRGFRAIRVLNMVNPPDPSDPADTVEYVETDGILLDPSYESILFPYVPDPFLGIPSSQFWFDWNGNGTAEPDEVGQPAWADENPLVIPALATPYWGAAGTYCKIDVLDHVYPPVSPRFPLNPLNNDTENGRPRFYDLQEAASRRYCWLALGAPSTGRAGPEGGPYQLRILIMFRAELTARYALQDPTVPNRHIEPQPADADYDSLFPHPWLVRFDDGNPGTFPDTNYTADPILRNGPTLPAGTVICTNEVGDLLPPGSIFVDFELGKAHTVLQNFPADSGGDYRWLILAPDPDLESPNEALTGMQYFYPDFPDYAWVIPPPIVRTGTGDEDYYFEGHSPLLAVVEAEIPRQ